MKKILLALTVSTVTAFTFITSAQAAPITGLGTIQQSVDTDVTIEGLTPVHSRSYRHRHGGVWYGPGIYIGPGFGIYGGGYSPGRSCRRVRRFCRNEWGRGRSYRRCVRRQGCRP